MLPFYTKCTLSECRYSMLPYYTTVGSLQCMYLCSAFPCFHKSSSYKGTKKVCFCVLYVYIWLCVITEQVAVLRGHSGLVKGVTWDPVGKYLATQVPSSAPLPQLWAITVKAAHQAFNTWVYNAASASVCFSLMTRHCGSGGPGTGKRSPASPNHSRRFATTSVFCWHFPVSLKTLSVHIVNNVSVLHTPMQCGGTTHVLRLDWSPSGDCLVSAHAMNNCGPVAQIVDRDGWKTSMDFVGHRKAITVVVSPIRPSFFKPLLPYNTREITSSCLLLWPPPPDKQLYLQSVTVWASAILSPVKQMELFLSKRPSDTWPLFCDCPSLTTGGTCFHCLPCHYIICVDGVHPLEWPVLSLLSWFSSHSWCPQFTNKHFISHFLHPEI